MCNDFVEYLNSMNNASSANENALAESQVLNKYYDYIKVDRELGDYIYNKLFDGDKKAIILTGHAGDGKTSILIQVLDKLGYFKNGKKSLKQSELYDNKLFYVKDMSELNEEVQSDILKDVLLYPNKGISSFLVSNTGPLINTFQHILDKDSFEELENELLNGLDTNNLEEIKLTLGERECSFLVINMAKLDNTYLIENLITKFTQPNLWKNCFSCDVKDKCPIYFNYFLCSNNKERIIDIIQKIYVWFQENESRLTVRQMVSHLSFAFTGNLNCKQIKEKIIYKNNVLFDYAFPNLFFGYKGTDVIQESFNIKGIKELNRVNLDENVLSADYKLFVDEDFTMFDNEVQKILIERIDNYQNSLEFANQDGINIRKAFRRYYIMISKLLEEENDILVENIFSEAYLLYDKICKEKIGLKEKGKLNELVFTGLYKIFIGVYPTEGDKTLYLTLKKNLDDVQNVQLILGEINTKLNMSIKQKEINNKIEKTNKMFEVYVCFDNCDEKLFLNLQMLQYFLRINEGEIFTSFNPNFTVGINRLKASLLKTYRYDKNLSKDENREIRLFIIKKGNKETIKFTIENEYMEVGV